MAEVFMSPRSYTYSGGDLIPYRERPDVGVGTGISIGTEPTAPTSIGSVTPEGRRGGGFWSAIDRFAGAINPIVEAAVAFKQGYQTGLPLPGRGPNDSRMAGDTFIFKILEDMRARNEASAERARMEREESRKAEARNQLILAGVESGKIDIKDALKILGGGLETLPGVETPSQTQTPPTPSATAPQSAPRQTDVYNDGILDNEPEAWGGRPRR